MERNTRPAGDGLPPLREVISRYGLAARKSLGQNFLLDLNLTDRIARTAGPLEDTLVIEIGPGPGGLTRALLVNGAAKVIAIERDERCIPALQDISAHYPHRLEVVSGDALTVDYEALTEAAGKPGRRVQIVANLPYNIGTQLLVGWLSLSDWPPFYDAMTLMFQREVAERIVAVPGDSSYGRLSVLAGWRCKAEIAFDISPKAFSPPPKITSTLIRLVPRQCPLPGDPGSLAEVTRAAFGQRRKMLRQSLKPLGGERLLEQVGLDGTRRPETLLVEEFLALANSIQSGSDTSTSDEA